MTFASSQVCLQLLRHPSLSYQGIAERLGITRQGVHWHAKAACRKFPGLAKHLHRRRGRPSTRPVDPSLN